MKLEMWLGLLGLGALHGLNPAMGWLFAVGIGVQERQRRRVWQALAPLALGHALAIAAALLVAVAVGLVLPARLVRGLVAAALIASGIHHLLRHRHPRFGGMRMDARELTLWSFLMASAHGAGLMALPLVLDAATPAQHAAGAHAAHMLAATAGAMPASALTATLVHTLGYLAVTGLLAVLVYEKLGLRFLRYAWINLDLFWAGALILAGVITPWL